MIKLWSLWYSKEKTDVEIMRQNQQTKDIKQDHVLHGGAWIETQSY